MDDGDEVARAAPARAAEPRRAGEHVAEAVARAQLEAGAFDLEIERALEHPQMMLEPGDRRRVERHRRAGGHADLDELAAQPGPGRRDRAPPIAALRILP